MPAQTKRRRLSLYSLPFVVAIGFLLVAKLAAWQQSDLVAELADCIAHGETREATDAVRKLTAMPSPPIPILVTAAAADEHETAEAGQVAISKLLRRWQRDIERKHRIDRVAAQLCELAESLDKQQGDFANADHAWLAITAGKILRLANSLPGKKTPMVAIHCDAILAAAGSGASLSESNLDVTNTAPVRSGTAETASVAASLAPNDRESSKADLEREISAYGTQSKSNGAQNDTGLPEVLQDSTKSSARQSTLEFNDAKSSELQAIAPREDALDGSNNLKDYQLSKQMLSPPNQLPDAEWSQPMFRILPMKPDGVAPVDERSRSASQSLRVAANGPLAEVDSRELLRQWLAVNGAEVPDVDKELAKRGFGKITARLVRQFFSDDAEQRMRLVDDVLAQPGAGAGAWLLMLAEDSDAEVRLFAVTLMATSNDSALVEKAWQVSIRDHDPRIADLAGRLRERRSGTLRR